MKITYTLFSITLLIFAHALRAGDWPQFLGPTRNGVAEKAELGWPKDGPKTLWKTKVGQGWSGPVVSSNRVFLFHRVGENETLDCFIPADGRQLWRAEYPSNYRDDFGFHEGPRATPAVDGSSVFTLGANGALNAWDVVSGKSIWRVDTRATFGSDKGFFGIACSPLVVGNALVLNIGGRDGAGIVAFNKATGAVLWKATDHEASYSSPVLAKLGGQNRLLVQTRRHLVALTDAGKVLWEFPWAPRIDASVSAAVPLVVGDQILISASYGAGAALLRFSDAKPEVIWSGDDILSNHYATSVHYNGLIFGFHGRQEQRCALRCVEMKTGNVRWSEERFGAGTVTIVGGQLLILTERGEVVLAPATTEKFTPSARAQVLGLDTRAHPAFANGVFYARDKTTLVAIDLRK